MSLKGQEITAAWTSIFFLISSTSTAAQKNKFRSPITFFHNCTRGSSLNGSSLLFTQLCRGIVSRPSPFLPPPQLRSAALNDLVRCFRIKRIIAAHHRWFGGSRLAPLISSSPPSHDPMHAPSLLLPSTGASLAAYPAASHPGSEQSAVAKHSGYRWTRR